MSHIPKVISKYINISIVLSYLYYKIETEKLPKKGMKLMTMNYSEISFKTTSPSYTFKVSRESHLIPKSWHISSHCYTTERHRCVLFHTLYFLLREQSQATQNPALLPLAWLGGNVSTYRWLIKKSQIRRGFLLLDSKTQW